MAARPAVLTTASQPFSRMADVIAVEDLASPSTMVMRGSDEAERSERSLAGERTKAMTVWLWERRAGIRREPRLPVAPRRRIFIVLEYVQDAITICDYVFGYLEEFGVALA